MSEWTLGAGPRRGFSSGIHSPERMLAVDWQRTRAWLEEDPMTDPVEAVLPHAVALSWGIAERPERGPKRELSIERIVESAIEIADVEGLGAVSMSRVATSLGFTTMSLYRYVTSKDDLLLLMQDQALDIVIPPEDAGAGWREQLREYVLHSRAAYRGHPWFGEIAGAGVLLTPNNLRLIDWGLRALADVALDAREKLAVVMLVSSYARSAGSVGSASSADLVAPGLGPVLDELVSDERFPFLRPVLLAAGADARAAVGPGAGHAAAGAPIDDAEFGLDRLLDGVEHYIGLTSGQREHDRLAASTQAVDDRLEFYPKDPAVREAAQKRREAEQKLREAQKREHEQIAKARERAAKQAARRA